jgi:hypothetical protein
LTPIYDKSGRVCGWLSNEKIYDLRGHATAFISRSGAFNLRGRHLGTFDSGNFRDHRGAVVSWIKGATGGPLKPVPSIPPIPPIASIGPIPPIPPIPSIPPIGSMSWSGMNWDGFISQ